MCNCDKPLYTQKEYDRVVLDNVNMTEKTLRELCDEQISHGKTKKKLATCELLLHMSLVFNFSVVAAMVVGELL